MELQANLPENSNKNVLEKRMKKSDMKAKNIFDYEYLTRTVWGFLPMKIEEENEDIILHFSLEGMRPLGELKIEETEYQFRFLQNFYFLQKLYQDYEIVLEEENIYFDNNFMPYIAFRDMRTQNEKIEEKDFLEAYQQLTAGILSRKYSLKQVQESGIEIVRKDKKAAFLFEAETAEDLHKEIEKKADEVYEDNRNNKVRLDKRSYRLRNRIAAVIFGTLLAVTVYTSYQTLVVLPRDKAVIRASRAYTVQDYVDCIDCLSKMKPEQMDTYTKYILAVSYAKSEALEKEELNNVLDRLSIYSNEIELEYWIAIGRADFDRAENVAQALSDDKLLIYAYMKELNYLEGNVTMDGEEKQNRMTELSNAITTIGEKYTEDEE